MLKSRGLTSFICWIFISTLFLSSMQVTLAGYQSADSTWFNLITLLIADEENEDSEKSEEENSSQDHWFSHEMLAFTSVETNGLKRVKHNDGYHHVFREVLSPPPKA